jgi:hypothetical protein
MSSYKHYTYEILFLIAIMDRTPCLALALPWFTSGFLFSAEWREGWGEGFFL